MVVEKELGQRIQHLRERAGLSQSALAELAGVPVGTLRNWEQGRREPLLSAAVLLAAALGVEVAGLLPTGDQKTPSEPPKRGRPRKPPAPAEDVLRLPIGELRKRVEGELEAAKGGPAKKPRKKGGAK